MDDFRNLVSGEFASQDGQEKEIGRQEGEIRCRERLGGLLRYYYREAA